MLDSDPMYIEAYVQDQEDRRERRTINRPYDGYIYRDVEIGKYNKKNAPKAIVLGDFPK